MWFESSVVPGQGVQVKARCTCGQEWPGSAVREHLCPGLSVTGEDDCGGGAWMLGLRVYIWSELLGMHLWIGCLGQVRVCLYMRSWAR